MGSESRLLPFVLGIIITSLLVTGVIKGYDLYEDKKFEDHAIVIKGAVKNKKVKEHEESTVDYIGIPIINSETVVDYTVTVNVDETIYTVKTDEDHFNKLEVGKTVDLKKYNGEVKLAQ
ncbi:hypothetical protein LSG23_20470 (plasmid) [Bacillus velezensis]|uniref:hypothetical protein n=1 Tax=Bacillus velezensis TaxID=492670 RepID=UPI000987E43C|nr:hypothetical protein [Bacillus velezensis]AQS42418.1 hypothetical protein BVH55_00030 [Bacillus velezensis]WNR83217.1 hypothetical protein RP314_20370 [Bacillus velezensis]